MLIPLGGDFLLRMEVRRMIMEGNQDYKVPEDVIKKTWELVDAIRQEMKLMVAVDNPEEEETIKVIKDVYGLLSTSLIAIICFCCPKEQSNVILDLVSRGIQRGYEGKERLNLKGG